MRAKLEDVVRQGMDISSHYLNPHQQQYKVFRHKGTVYAVKYSPDNPPRPMEHIEMWKSHNKESHHSRTYLDKGLQGVVFTKTKDKAVKHFKTAYHDDNPMKNLHESQETNLKLLDQKFVLHDLKIDQHFIIGLHNNKRAGNANLPPNHAEFEYIMPKIENIGFINEASLITFIHALKKANENGLAHPDYCIMPHHESPQNEFSTVDGIKLIDLDMGLNEFSAAEFTNDPLAIYSRDQWLLVYNHKKQPGLHWRDEIETWYKNNPGKALSENPADLLDIVKYGGILLPPDILKDLEKQVALLPPRADSQLISAVKKGDLTGVQQLIAFEKRSRVESKEEQPYQKTYNPALLLAVKLGHINIVRELLSAGADINAKENNQFNAMDFAIQKENVPLIKVLLKAGANPKYLLYKIQDWESQSFKKVLHSAGLREAGYTLLESINDGNHSMVRKLVTAHSKCPFINNVDKYQKTALMLAAEKGDKHMVKLLLSAGADYTLKDREGKTAEQLAKPPLDFNKILNKVMDEKKRGCMQKLRSIDGCRFKNDDVMTHFVHDKQQEIVQSKSLKELSKLDKSLHNTYKQLKPVTDTLKKTLTDLAAKMEFGSSAKANKIEAALATVPIADRNLNLDNESPLQTYFPILEEIARPRGFMGGAGEVAYDPNTGVIDVDKAAKSYKEFRIAMQNLRKSAEIDLSSDSDYAP
ncbi:ankyrin repeat domain-containing protein [Legionella maioricensis]|uniref:Ankyrin repeat domain-containing protein n=1 Tax=Legionella maioricensis TaxID=2896528 RepID=A0A9X2CZY9_9GAMM|nr:ankyrin repeat domain-containing protein [Legionella maioricensis]MCL9683964.1 ankyrin repeat domain-containing protein [Legionella maioricensis]MCL9687991.1 ankyrin repeat domain-containing protein [Legionella maioricensis]